MICRPEERLRHQRPLSAGVDRDQPLWPKLGQAERLSLHEVRGRHPQTVELGAPVVLEVAGLVHVEPAAVVVCWQAIVSIYLNFALLSNIGRRTAV